MARRKHITLLLVAVFALLTILFLSVPGGSSAHASYNQALSKVTESHLRGVATAPKLQNDTLKAELGNAAWKVLHTTMAKFPDKPTEEDSSSLEAFVYLFARLYPCGECARHFQSILDKFPPQVGSRMSAAAWACHVHNEVNKSLKKPSFDCAKIGDFYDCGCADDDDLGTKTKSGKTKSQEDGQESGG